MTATTIHVLLPALTAITVTLAVCALLLMRRGKLQQARTTARLGMLTVAPYAVLMGLLVHAWRDGGESKATTLARCISISMSHGVLAVPALWLAAFVSRRVKRVLPRPARTQRDG